MRVRTFRFFSLAFVVVGMAVFTVQVMRGDALTIFTSPMTVALILFPFIPASVFAFIAERAQKKLEKMLHQDEAKGVKKG